MGRYLSGDKRDMGMNAEILAIGPFSESVVAAMDYNEESYKDVPPGTIVITTILRCQTSEQSRMLAHAAGCKPFDFSTHQINIDNCSRKDLIETMVMSIDDEHVEEEVDKLFLLARNGFQLFYMPNG